MLWVKTIIYPKTSRRSGARRYRRCHYDSYALDKLDAGKEQLFQELDNWAKDQFIKSYVIGTPVSIGIS